MLYFPVVTGDKITLLCRIASLQLLLKTVPILFGNKWSISLRWSTAPLAARQLGSAPGRGIEKIPLKGTGIPKLCKSTLCSVSDFALTPWLRGAETLDLGPCGTHRVIRLRRYTGVPFSLNCERLFFSVLSIERGQAKWALAMCMCVVTPKTRGKVSPTPAPRSGGRYPSPGGTTHRCW